MASPVVGSDKYRSYLSGHDGKNTEWRYGDPPNYNVVNKLFKVYACCVCILYYMRSSV